MISVINQLVEDVAAVAEYENPQMDRSFYVYMMTNRSRVVLYTGVTNSLEVRLGFMQTQGRNRLRSDTKSTGSFTTKSTTIQATPLLAKRRSRLGEGKRRISLSKL